MLEKRIMLGICIANISELAKISKEEKIKELRNCIKYIINTEE